MSRTAVTDESRLPQPHLALVLVNVMANCAILGTIGAFLARVWWPLDVMSNFRFQYFWLLLLLCGPMAWVGYRKHAALAGACGLINLAFIVPLYFGATPARVGESHLRVMAINVLTSNRDYDEVLSIVARADPDLLVLSEVDQRWIDGIAAIHATLPHVRAAPRELSLPCTSTRGFRGRLELTPTTMA